MSHLCQAQRALHVVEAPCAVCCRGDEVIIRRVHRHADHLARLVTASTNTWNNLKNIPQIPPPRLAGPYAVQHTMPSGTHSQSNQTEVSDTPGIGTLQEGSADDGGLHAIKYKVLYHSFEMPAQMRKAVHHRSRPWPTRAAGYH